MAGSISLTSCGSSGNTVTAPSTLSKCAVTVDGPDATIPASGGAGTINVQTQRECQWTAQPEASWLSITAGSSGQGAGAVQFTAAPNADPASRTGGVMVNGQRAQVSQAAGECRFELSSNATALPKTGGTGSVDVRASSALCTWTAGSNVDWISITSNPNGKGSAAVTFTVAPTTGPSRAGTLTIAGQNFSVTESEGCNYTVNPTTFTAGAEGGIRSVAITAAAGCPWTAASNADWITITSPANGSGSGTVTINVAPDSGPSRSGTLSVAGQTVTISQGDGCSFALAPDAQSFPASGGSGSVTVTAAAGCAWTATSAQSWIGITSGANGNGSGTVNFTVASTSGPGRSGMMTIAGHTFTINQGQGCTFSLSTTSSTVPASGGSDSFDVRTADGCGWTASSSVSWLTVTAGATGSGNGTVRYSAAASTGPERTGTISAGGQTFTLTQSAGCTYSISPVSQTVASGGGALSLAVTAAAGCSWTATSNDGWISITSGASGSGPGTVQFSVAPNSGAARSGTLTVGGQTFTVTQASGCSAVVAPDTIAMPAQGGSQTVSISTAADCAWTAASNTSWITIAMPASGSGDGTVRLDTQANADAARSGTATIAGKLVTVNQDSGCTIAISPASTPMVAGGGSGSVTVTAGAGCTWTAVSNVTWITLTGNASGSGPGTVTFNVDANVSGTTRSGAITIGGQVFTVNQAGT